MLNQMFWFTHKHKTRQEEEEEEEKFPIFFFFSLFLVFLPESNKGDVKHDSLNMQLQIREVVFTRRHTWRGSSEGSVVGGSCGDSDLTDPGNHGNLFPFPFL